MTLGIHGFHFRLRAERPGSRAPTWLPPNAEVTSIDKMHRYSHRSIAVVDSAIRVGTLEVCLSDAVNT